MTKQKKKIELKDTHSNTNDWIASLREWQWFAIFAVLAAIFFRELIFQSSFLWEDFIYQFYPYRNFASVSLTNGEMPLWNPYTFSGMPFLADITGTSCYLPHLLLVPFVSAGKLNFWYVEMYILIHVLLAGITMFYCMRAFGVAKIPSAFSGLVYMLSGFMIVHIIHLVIICQVAWMPLVVLLFYKTLKTRSLTSMIIGGLVLSLVVCGGHIQITLYFLLFLFVFFVGELISFIREQHKIGSEKIAKQIMNLSLLALGIIVIAVGLSAVQLLPTNELTKYSVREEFSFTKSTEGELWWQQLITMLIPKFFGTSNALGSENSTPYWGPEYNWNFWETCFYTGIPGLTLALFALKFLKKNRHIVVVAGFALFALLYALGDHFFIHSFFFNFVPGFGKFRSVGRWGFFFVFAVAFMSGFGLQELLNSKIREKFYIKVMFVTGAITLLITLAVHLHLVDSLILGQVNNGAFRFESANVALPVAYEIAQSQTLISIFIVFVSLSILFLLWRRKLTSPLGILLLFLVQFLDMYIFGFDQNNGKINPDEHFNQQTELIRMWKEEGKSEYFRINMRNSNMILLDRNQGMMDKIFLLEGYSQLGLQWRYPVGMRSYDLLNAKYRLKLDTVIAQSQPQLQSRLAVDSSYVHRAFIVYNYKTFATARQESLFICSSQFDPRNVVTLRGVTDDLLSDTTLGSGAKADIQSYTNNTIGLKVFTPKKGILVLSEIYFPGWNAYVDGQATHIYRADWSLRALVVDQGEHKIELRYEPTSFFHGAAISLSTLGLCIAGLVILYVRNRKAKGFSTSS
jgi:hypothetical protein